MALPVAQLVFRRVYYGVWAPNTYTLKVQDIPLKEAMGVEYVQLFFYFWPAVYALQVASIRVFRHPMASWLALVPWVGVGYSALVGGDELGEFQVSWFPCCRSLRLVRWPRRIVLFGGAASGVGGVPGRYGWIALLLVVGAFRSFCTPEALSELGTWRGGLEEQNVRIGLTVEKNTTPEAKVAHFWAGAAVYFSERPAQDMLGKNDREIAHRPGNPMEWQPGHTKYDPVRSMSLAPDVVVTALPALYLDEAVRAASPEKTSYPGLIAIYDDPTFQAQYVPGLVQLPVSRNYHAVFVRNGTKEATPAAGWRP